MDKLTFWKKDDLDFGKMDAPIGPDPLGKQNDPLGPGVDPLSSPLGNDPLAGNSTPPRVNDFGMGNQQQHFDSVSPQPTADPFAQNNQFSSQPMGGGNRDLELISAKIDTIKATIENLSHKIETLNQKVASIEAIAKQEQQQQW